ncbi:nitroreductase family protein [Methylotenera sp.]|uniref:nitroreductase family protein n=1 Tax=Methylotenera sp. TaxID=2051956 RepID=UPI00248902C1|nr:nitroreductase family protein [Methylotenera sp.]MDI1361797.1 nitroreductase family protein [Methylotenera sp.]
MLSIKAEKDIFETILARRSVRSFKKNKIPQGIISSLLEAAVRAPTAVHQEPWGFVIIQDEQTLKTLSDYAKPLFLTGLKQRELDDPEQLLDVFESQNFNIFYDADALILICGKTSSPFYAADCWLAAENLMLVACAMNLGSCVIGSAVEAFNTSDIRNKFGIPNNFTAVAPIALGYPNVESPPTSRKAPLIFTRIASD